MYEHKRLPPLPRPHFLRRLLLHMLASGSLVLASLGAGMAGYHWLEGLAWLDAFLNAAMLLGGMGPIENPHTEAGKLFAGIYALYAGLVFLVAIGIVLAPVAHRILHRFHWDEGERE